MDQNRIIRRALREWSHLSDDTPLPEQTQSISADPILSRFEKHPEAVM
jgi:hypothetical protein